MSISAMSGAGMKGAAGGQMSVQKALQQSSALIQAHQNGDVLSLFKGGGLGAGAGAMGGLGGGLMGGAGALGAAGGLGGLAGGAFGSPMGALGQMGAGFGAQPQLGAVAPRPMAPPPVAAPPAAAPPKGNDQKMEKLLKMLVDLLQGKDSKSKKTSTSKKSGGNQKAQLAGLLSKLGKK